MQKQIGFLEDGPAGNRYMDGITRAKREKGRHETYRKTRTETTKSKKEKKKPQKNPSFFAPYYLPKRDRSERLAPP